jgi:hypothetical protein
MSAPRVFPEGVAFGESPLATGSRDFQADSALASGHASGNQLRRPGFAR